MTGLYRIVCSRIRNLTHTYTNKTGLSGKWNVGDGRIPEITLHFHWQTAKKKYIHKKWSGTKRNETKRNDPEKKEYREYTKAIQFQLFSFLCFSFTSTFFSLLLSFNACIWKKSFEKNRCDLLPLEQLWLH